MEKIELVKAMDTVVKHLNNEDGYFGDWIFIVPDGADDEDFKTIAESEDLLIDAVDSFKEIMSEYAKDGFVVGNVLY